MEFREHSCNNPINSDRCAHKSLSIAFTRQDLADSEQFIVFAQFLIINQMVMQSFYS